ncbi:MAG: class I SAM-dependent methyltransferase [Terriglobia bacterium]
MFIGLPVENQDRTKREEQLRAEFNRWAEAGRGEEMREEHLHIAQKMLAQISFAPDDKILDIGCGIGWLCGLLVARVPRGQVVGIDVADEMIRRARTAYADRINMMFIIAGVADIPWDDTFFNKVVSVEAAYYWPAPAQGFREIYRVLQPQGTVWILLNLYKENVSAHQWAEKLAVPVHLLSGEEWCGLMQQAGFAETRQARIVDTRPVPDDYDYHSQWFKNADQVRRFRAAGALLLCGRKPPPG